MSTQLTARQCVIARGRLSSTTRYSQCGEWDSRLSAQVLETWGTAISDERRDQILGDPTFCSQWVSLWESQLGALTRPSFTTVANTEVVVASYGDTIGEITPVCLNKNKFRSHFVSLVRKEDADFLGLAQHPSAPDTIQGPIPEPTLDVPNPVGEAASTARLQFSPADSGEDRDQPVIVALPVCMPIPVGKPFPHGLDLITGDLTSLRANFRELVVWIEAVRYITTFNDGWSVTEGGPLFELADLVVPQGQDPWHGLRIAPTADIDPTLLAPHHPAYGEVAARMHAWADATWFQLGSLLTAPGLGTATPATAGTQGSQPSQATADTAALAASIEALVTKLADKKSPKEQQQATTAARIEAVYRLMFAQWPEQDGEQDMILPAMKPEFQAILAAPRPQDAAIELKGMLTTVLDVFNCSDKNIYRDCYMDPDACTLQFSNCWRSAHWHENAWVVSTKQQLESSLSLLHFLPPNTHALRALAASEYSNAPIVMAHTADDKAQLDASHKSKMYVGGSMESPTHVY